LRPVPRSLSLLLALACFALAPAAHAAGVELRWDQCYGDGGVQNKNFACDTNSGTETLVGGFVLGTDMQHVSGTQVIVDIGFAGFTAPAWWQFRALGSCRQFSLSLDLLPPAPAVHCSDWTMGSGLGAVGNYNTASPGAYIARLIAGVAVPSNALQDLIASQEYFAFAIHIDHQKTIGAGSCAGCTTPACIVFSSIDVTTPIATDNTKLISPANGTDSNFCTWQGGGGLVNGCPASTPMTLRTWGAVKALYR